jgi:hypothetical protein
MLRSMLVFLVVRRAAKLAESTSAQSSNWGTVLGTAFSVSDVLTSAGLGVAALGALVVGLKLGPKWAFSIVRMLKGAVR